MSSRRLVSGSCLLPPLTDPTEFATYRAQAEATRRDDLYPLLRSPRPRSLSAGSADRQPETLQISCPPASARKTLRPEVGAIEAETTSKRRARPRLFHALRHAPQDVAAQILIEAEKLLRIHGHQKLRVADVADTCGFSAANVYRYFSSRRIILDALASHYLREVERMALLGAIYGSKSARDRLSDFLTGLNTTLVIFSDSEPQIGELLAETTAEQWPCYSHYDAQIVRRIARILNEALLSGEFHLEGNTEQEARRVKAAACALVEPDVIRLCRKRYDVRTRESLSHLIADALLNHSASAGDPSPHALITAITGAQHEG